MRTLSLQHNFSLRAKEMFAFAHDFYPLYRRYDVVGLNLSTLIFAQNACRSMSLECLIAFMSFSRGYVRVHHKWFQFQTELGSFDALQLVQLLRGAAILR